ncbi:hypothetical protein [Vibrio harveyi]|uniref:hypothetical protein n=1 Tax=Vibrio harveyi TaxID=669 RepID=UPI002480AD87|nr:hypothetical protein [Vibrio harveyi]
MEKLEIITNEKLPHIRYLSLDALVYLTFNAKLQELEVHVTTMRTTASVQVKQTVAVSNLIHSARISDEGHVFPILRTDSSNIYISFDELKGYLTACEFCGIEPDSEVCENARASEVES